MTLDIHFFWGKAQPMGDGPGYHPLPLHSLDVAAVGNVLLTSERGPARTLPDLLGISLGETVRVVSCLLALHDVGKFAKRFQAKAPQWFPSIFTDSPDALATQFDHGTGGLRLFEAEPATFHAPPDIRALRLLACAVFGHHGSPPSTQGGAPLIGDFGKPGLAAARLFVGEICDLFGLAGGWPHLDLELRATRVVRPCRTGRDGGLDRVQTRVVSVLQANARPCGILGGSPGARRVGRRTCRSDSLSRLRRDLVPSTSSEKPSRQRHCRNGHATSTSPEGPRCSFSRTRQAAAKPRLRRCWHTG